MRWSLKFAEVAGIGIYVHATFAILIAWIAMGAWLQERALGAVLGSVAFILCLFGCVVLHELGHALTARRFGIRTRDITLLPIGGLARLERMPEKPSEEFLVALAGPAVNVVIAGAIAAWLRMTGTWDWSGELSLLSGPFLQRMFAINLFLAAFNLLPAFPMDGGRALRALLAGRMGYASATQVAATIGQGMALLFGLLGLLGNPFLVFIALFVWIGAAAEASVAQMKAALAGVPVAQAMLTRFETVSPTDTLGRAVELTLAGSQKDFPVVEGGVFRGMLTQGRLLAGLAHAGRHVPVGCEYTTDPATIDSHEMLEAALDRLDELSVTTLPVIHEGALVGLLTMDNLAEYLNIRKALDERPELLAKASPAALPRRSS